MSAFFDSKSEINAIHPAFVVKLGFEVQFTNIEVQKIDGIIFKTYGMVVVAFLIIDQDDKIKFFEDSFLVENISLDVVFGIICLTLSNANVNFLKKNFDKNFIPLKKLFLSSSKLS